MWLALPEIPNGRPFDDAPDWHGESGNVSEHRCTYLSITASSLAVPGVLQALRVPVYRCQLAADLIARLRASEEGARLADMMEAPPIDGVARMLSGPDLEAIAPIACTTDRCERSCRPGYRQILREFGLSVSSDSDDPTG